MLAGGDEGRGDTTNDLCGELCPLLHGGGELGGRIEGGIGAGMTATEPCCLPRERVAAVAAPPAATAVKPVVVADVL